MATMTLYKKYIMLIVFIQTYISLFGQLTPINNVASPEVANLGLYGSVPVGMSTGTPNISIPLHSFKVGKYSLSMSADYHLADVKPDNQGGVLGIGWGLMVGGYITRTVRGDADELCGTDGIAHGYYSNAYRQNAVLQSGYAHILDNVSGENYYELTPDEFSFSFCGYSGNFYYSPEGWKVVSDDDIKVEFNDINGFLTFNELRPPLGNETNYTYKRHNNRFFNRFTLITSDGTRYIFGGKYATEYSVDYYNRGAAFLTATTWKLSEIQTVDGRTISFTYNTNQLLYDIRYIPQYLSAEYFYEGYDGDYARYTSGNNAYCGHLLFPVSLEKIETENDIAEFAYIMDDKYGSRITEKAIYNSSRDNSVVIDPYHSYITSNMGFLLFTGLRGTYRDDHEKYMALKNCFKKVYLSSIHVYKNHGDTITFRMGYYNGAHPNDQTTSKRTKLHYITTAYKYKKEELAHQYVFNYNPSYNYYPMNWGEMYAKYDVDDYGYANGSLVNISATPFFSSKSPNPYTTKAETLKSITFPTKGYVKFEYELHDFSKKVRFNHTLRDSCGTAGGLRLKTQTTYDYDDKILGIKEYKYTNNIGSSVSSGILAKEKYKTMNLYVGDKYVGTFKSEGSYIMPSTNQNSPDVSYSIVFEINKDSRGNVVDYTRYDYSNFDVDVYGNRHMDVTALYSSTTNPYLAPYTSNSLERGKLLAETVFNNSHDTIAKTMYQYRLTGDRPLPTIYQQYIALRGPLSVIDGFVGWVTNTHMHRYLLNKMIKSKYTNNQKLFSTETAYSYDSHKMLSRKTEKTSKNQEINTFYKYTSGAHDSIAFIAKHILSMPYSETKTYQNSVWISQNNYSFANNQVPYVISNVTVTPGGVRTTNYQVTEVDFQGNPLEILFPDSTYCSYMWSHNGQTLAASVRNVRYQALVESADLEELIDLDESNSNRMLEIHSAWMNRMPSALIDFYSYDTSMNLLAHINPFGKADFYTYDALDRLRSAGLYQPKEEYGHKEPALPFPNPGGSSRRISISSSVNGGISRFPWTPETHKTYDYNYHH